MLAGADTASVLCCSNNLFWGLDQSVSANLVFLLAMMLYPESQLKAQDEIDAVVGRDRLPDFNDQPNLPYVNALCKEVLRWQNVTPLCELIGGFSCQDWYMNLFSCDA